MHSLGEVAKIEVILTSHKLITTNKVTHLIKAPSGTPETSQERPSRVIPQIRTCLSSFKIKTHQKSMLSHNKRKISKLRAMTTKRILEIQIIKTNTARKSNKRSPKTKRNLASST